MAKKVSPFADDFQNLSRTAESVVQLVKQQEESTRKQAVTPEKVASNESESTKTAVADSEGQPGQSSLTESEEKSVKPKKAGKPKSAKPLSSQLPVEWGKPISLFNTRIPPEMAGLLDDLVYQFKKKGTPRTKQDLAQEALQDLLKKHAAI